MTKQAIVTKQAIIDTGPLVAFLDSAEKHHKWTVEQIHQFKKPLFICEAVLTEAMYLLRRLPAAKLALFKLFGNGSLVISFDVSDNLAAISGILSEYDDVEVSLADACIVRMAELNDNYFVFTLDSDFQTYRKHKHQPIKLICPG